MQLIFDRLAVCFFIGALLVSSSASAQETPKGEIIKYTFDQSRIFPGTTREVSIYVPKQYDPAKPACVYVNQDGVQYKAPEVFDTLISKGEMPITIGVFVTPGIVKPTSDQALPRFNRSFEYDGLGDGYARFVLDELLPMAERSSFPRMATIEPLAERAVERFVHSQQPGNGPTLFVASSARLEPMWDCGADRTIRR